MGFFFGTCSFDQDHQRKKYTGRSAVNKSAISNPKYKIALHKTQWEQGFRKNRAEERWFLLLLFLCPLFTKKRSPTINLRVKFRWWFIFNGLTV